MADPSPPPASAAGAGAGAGAGTAVRTDKPQPASAAKPGASYKAPAPNPALRMMGLPALPKKLPSRNWMIFIAVTGSLSAAVIYDRREKSRATARWARAVSRLAREPLASPSQLPRKLTVFLESPPTDGLRVAQDHFTEYVKPVLAASGLDWEFVQGRKEGDVRAAVAERIRRARDPDNSVDAQKTQDELVREIRKKNGTPEYEGVRGDIVIGRHTWKEYVRGLHEGWLGPLTAPSLSVPEVAKVQQPAEATQEGAAEGGAQGEEQAAKAEEKKKPDQKPDQKPERPPQPPPYNTTDDYPSSALPMFIPAEFSPSAPIVFPHILGFSNTFVRLRRFLNRRRLADDIGREVAAACFATAREYREDGGAEEAEAGAEQQTALAAEEGDWPKSVWKEEEVAAAPQEGEGEGDGAAPPPPRRPAEKIWTRPLVLDPRISERMRRFEITPEEEARAREIVVPEEEVEGWIKGSLRGLWRWATTKPEPMPTWVE
ncbi:mitochondrial import inner membrane translocase subunit Tim54 [Xylariaceae sp. FL0804]|nr:mitochondrial import inner membrane translocase subunit Tim54 [Xylariaceae sp. FL0804]